MKLTKEQVRAILAEPNGSERLATQPEAALDAAWALFAGEGNAAACAFLCACAKKRALRAALEQRMGDRSDLYAALQNDAAPKLRKNAARLCGALGSPEDVPALVAALEREQTRFVRPSLLLALGKLGGPEAERALSAYVVEPGEEKHVKAEQEALRLAKARMSRPMAHAFTGLLKPCAVELRTPKWLAETCAGELRALGFRPQRVFAEGVRLTTDDLPGLYRARCFSEALLPLGRCAQDAASVAALCAGLADLLCASHDGAPPFAYRIDYVGQDRANFARRLSEALNDPRLINNPSAYEVELRVESSGAMAAVYVKLFTLPDPRFTYRKKTVPAGMHPATAAAVLRSALPHLRAGARVLDPCCGGGTLLFEREKLLECASLTGVDIAHAAIDIARENAIAANSRAKFIVNDMRRFVADRPYDELIANLPFGNRVSTHAENEQLYAILLASLSQWVRPGGIALLYTMEFVLLKKLLRNHDELLLLQQGRTDAGGLMPGIFLLQVGQEPHI